MELALAHETMARWQFGITTVYHFLFVPLTIALSALVAGLQTAWVRTGREKYFKATKFWGKLFLINMAMGVVTGIVQEFQFGMSWSNYSRFVGDIFGAPLAFEALIAFFFESTFIGLWIFGWDRLPKKLHLLSIWMVAIGTNLSAYFILAANSWMQHPVGYELKNGRAQLTDFPKVLFQNTTLVVVFHTLTAAFLVGGAFMIGIAAYQLRKSSRQTKAEQHPVKVASMVTSLRLGLVVCLLAGLGTAVSGDALGKVMFEQQPMKMAAAEALWDTQAPAPFSIFAYGDVSKGHNTVEITIPGLLSFLAKGDFTSPVPGINNTNAAERAKYGDKARNGDYKPNIPTTFWAFRWMIGFGMTSFVVGMVGLWLTRRRFWLAPEYRRAGDEVPLFMLTKTKELGPTLTKWVWRGGIWTLGFPLIACSWGWIFTEMGRQPWVVYGLMTTADAVSPGVSVGEQWTSLIVLTLLYGILAVIEVKLMVKYAKAGPTDEEPPRRDPRLGGPPAGSEDADKPFAFAY